MEAEHSPERRSAARDAGTKTAQPSPAPVVQAGGLGVPLPEGGGRGEGADWEVLRPLNPTSWFHPRGIYKVLARITPKLPDVEGCLFLTFTFDPALFNDAGTAFDLGRDRMRRLFFKLRRGVEWKGKRYVIDAPYCVKVEFHANDWAHFHAVFLTRRFVPGDMLNALWGFGRTNVERITNDDFRYLLKYVTKGVSLPEWVLKRPRLRVFQSSRGFYATESTTTRKPATGKKRGRIAGTLGERLERWQRTALLQNGETFCQVILCAPYAELLAEQILPAALDGRYLGGGHLKITDHRQLIPWISKTL